MREILDQIDDWLASGENVALATVIETWGSSPRPAGARMALTASGSISGSVSGGCVEGSVVEEGLQVLAEGRPRLLHYGIADETAWQVGLACGGEIEVFVQPLEPGPYRRLAQALRQNETLARITVIDGPAGWVGREITLFADGTIQGELHEAWSPAALELAREMLAGGQPAQQRLRLMDNQDGERETATSTGPFEGLDLFVERFDPGLKLILVGGVHIAIALASLAQSLNFRTVVVDPRRSFGSQSRFPYVDRLLQTWPGEAFAEIGLDAQTAVATLTHDPKIDDPALTLALASPAFYVGALGSRRTQEKRWQRLKEAGVSEADLSRIHGPIGLDLGGRTPEEIALAILAEIVATRYGKT